jgi:hypothetical protein
VTLHYIDVGYACFGLIVEGGKVTKAPPIAAWTVGKSAADVRFYYQIMKKARRYETVEVA